MSSSCVLETLETDRLILRYQRVDDAFVYRQLWTERDFRVPAHRRIDPEGRPSVEDIAAQIRAEQERSGPGLLAVQRKDTADVIGYCGLKIDGNGSSDEPELAYELLRTAHGCGYATEAGQAVVTWANEADTNGCGPGSGSGMLRRGGSWRSSVSTKWVEWSQTLNTATTC